MRHNYEVIEVRAELLFELASKDEWVRRVPQCLPKKTRAGETWIWIDKNGDVFECGADFMAAEEMNTYPCKVFRLSNVAGTKILGTDARALVAG
jgi:hypothetical protein